MFMVVENTISMTSAVRFRSLSPAVILPRKARTCQIHHEARQRPHSALHGATPAMALGLAETFSPLERLLP